MRFTQFSKNDRRLLAKKNASAGISVAVILMAQSVQTGQEQVISYRIDWYDLPRDFISNGSQQAKRNRRGLSFGCARNDWCRGGRRLFDTFK
jgi:hypothetical protein